MWLLVIFLFFVLAGYLLKNSLIGRIMITLVVLLFLGLGLFLTAALSDGHVPNKISDYIDLLKPSLFIILALIIGILLENYFKKKI